MLEGASGQGGHPGPYRLAGEGRALESRSPRAVGGPRLEAGVSRVALPAPRGVELMGYALRRGGASGELDPLSARGLFLRGAETVGLVALDLCLLAPAQAQDVRRRVEARTGVPASRIAVTCTHTHSAPDTGMRARMAGEGTPPHVAALLDAAVEAAVQAHAALAPARLGTGVARVAPGRNRRREGGAVDPLARILRLDHGDGSPMAVVFLHGCHPTVLGHDNLLVSADWPGAARTEVERRLPGAQGLFLLSAHGDVDPRTRGLQDLIRPGRSVGAPAGAMQALGREVGTAVAEAARTIPTRERATVAAAALRVPVEVHGGPDPAAAERSLAERRRAALEALGFAPDARPGSEALWRRADALAGSLPAAEARERMARFRLFVRDRVAPDVAGGRAVAVELQAFRLGDAAWLALPFEPTVRVGAEWAERVARLGGESPAGAEGPDAASRAAILSIANGWLRYLPHPEEFACQDAHLGYEVLSSTLAPAEAGRLLAAGSELLAGLPA